MATPQGTLNAFFWLPVSMDLFCGLTLLMLPVVLLQALRRSDLGITALILWCCVLCFAEGMVKILSVGHIWYELYWAEMFFKAIAVIAIVLVTFLAWQLVDTLRSLPSQKQLQESNAALSMANRELEAFAAAVSHDLRAPLASISGQAGLLELSIADKMNADELKRLHRIQHSVRQMSELLEALLGLSRVTRHTLNHEWINLSQLAQAVINDLRQRDPTRMVEVNIQPNMSAYGDRSLLLDLLSNLLHNAWKFTANSPRPIIDVGQTVHTDTATLWVRDNGVGFDMKVAQRIFEPFQRLQSAHDFAGTGVGLATVARIVARHGGRVWAKGDLNQGAVIYCTLPIVAFGSPAIQDHTTETTDQLVH